MKEIKLETNAGSTRILINESIDNLSNYATSDKTLIVTDSNVAKLHGSRFSGYEKVVLETGERNKTLASVQKIYDKCLEMELERDSYIVGIGGGMVCDVAGFAAATYLRGINCGLVPTTLLAQVDASIGGKNGVNLEGYKNLIGTIRQPEFCLCDLEVLKTLPKEEIVCGYAEVIKQAAIADENLFKYLEEKVEKALALDRTTMEKIVHDSIKVKTDVVRIDEFEKNERRKLNFGHTIGHGIEKVMKIPHGKAVAIGMMIAARVSKKKNGLKSESVYRLEKLISSYGLPTGIKEIVSKKEQIMDAVKKDKKRTKNEIKMCLLDKIGSAKIVQVGISEIEAVLDDMH